MYAPCVSGAVNVRGFVWKFVCAICNISFIHSCMRQVCSTCVTACAELYLDQKLPNVNARTERSLMGEYCCQTVNPLKKQKTKKQKHFVH